MSLIGRPPVHITEVDLEFSEIDSLSWYDSSERISTKKRTLSASAPDTATATAATTVTATATATATASGSGCAGVDGKRVCLSIVPVVSQDSVNMYWRDFYERNNR